MRGALSLRASVFAVFIVLVTIAASGGAAQGGKGVPVGDPKNPETWYLRAEALSEQAKDKSLSPDAARARETLFNRSINRSIDRSVR